MNGLKIAVIGCGSAGQAASLFLKRSGNIVEVFEKVPSPQPIGAGFLLQPTAFVPLQKLGLFEEVYKHGSKIERLIGETQQKRRVMDLNYTELHKDLHGLGLSRGTLYSIFLKEMAERNIPVHVDHDITEIIQSKKGKTIMKDSKGREHGEYDLIVIADGSRSKIRDKIHSEHTKVRPYKWGTLYAIVEDKDSHFTKNGILRQVFNGTKKMMGMLPTGYRSKGSVNPFIVIEEDSPSPQSPLVTMFWSLHKKEIDNFRKGDFEKWKKEVIELSEHSRPIVDQLKNHSHVNYANYYDVRMYPYHSLKLDHVVFIGDCAHAMSPVLGQGVNLALQDSMILSELIEAHNKEEDGLKIALDQYSKKRKKVLSFYQNVSR